MSSIGNIGISIIIVNFNKRTYVVRLLDSLFAMKSPGLNCRIVVVDNASMDDTVPYIRERFGDRVEMLVNQQNTGGSGGFSRGIEYVLTEHNNDFLWLLDNDVVVAEDALPHLVDFLLRQPDTGAIGSTMLKMNKPDTVNEMGGSVDWKHGRLILNHRDKLISEIGDEPEEVEYCAAASLLVRRKMVEDIGYWMDFFIHYDDVEWCLRMRRSGWKVYAHPLSLIWHETFEYKPVTWIRYYNIRNLLYLYDICSAPGKYIKLWKLFLYRLHLRSLGLHIKALQVRSGVRDYQRGVLGKKEPIPTYKLHPVSELSRILKSAGKFHFVVPDQKGMKDILGLLDPVTYSGAAVILYEPINNREARVLQDCYNIKVVRRLPGFRGILKLLFSHVVRRILRREYAIIHSRFEDRRTFPHLARRCIIHPMAEVFIA